MAERTVKFIVENLFNLRFWVLIIGSLGIYFIASDVAEQGASPRDIIQVVTGCALIIALFYTIITYEYNHRKFKYDVKTSRDTLSFNIALEWHKPDLINHIKACSEFYKANKILIDENKGFEFNAEVEKDEHVNQKRALLALFNYFECIALGVKQGIMDEEFTKGFFKSIFSQYLMQYQFYIDYKRKHTSNPRTWCNFTELATRWEKS